MYFPLDEYHERWRRVHAKMTERGYDIAVVWGQSGGNFQRHMEILWLTNFFSNASGQMPDSPGSRVWQANSYSCAILEPGREPELIGDEPEPRRELLAVGEYRWAQDPVRGAAEALKARGVQGLVAFVGSDCLPVKYADQFRAQTPGIDYVFDDDLIRELRMIKSPRELDCFREGGEIVTKALNRLCEGLLAGKQTAEAAADASHEVVRRGGSWHRIPTNFGETLYTATELTPLYGYNAQAPKTGDMAWGMVYGPIFQGYWLDPGRTLVVGGKPTAEQKALLEESYTIIQKIIDMAKPGVKLKDIAVECDRMKTAMTHADDYKDKMWPYYAHGNGMLWEPPFISQTMSSDEDVIQEGMVFGAEVFITRQGVGHADWEDNFVVTAKGAEVITTSPVFWY